MFNKLFKEQIEALWHLEFPNYCVNASTIVDFKLPSISYDLGRGAQLALESQCEWV